MSMMSQSQRSAQNAALFRKNLTTLHMAGVGVILTRTREPYRATEIIKQFAQADKRSFKVWTVLHGWETYKLQRPDQPPEGDTATKDPMAALTKLTVPENSEGVFVMIYPHPYLKQSLPFIAQVKEFARDFPETLKRLILVTPPGFTLPPELEDDISILDFDTPSVAELQGEFAFALNALEPAKRPKLDQSAMDSLLSAGAGLTAHEAVTALSRALVENRASLPAVSVDALRSVIMDVKVEAVRKTDILEVMPPTDMSNVGGLENLKEWVEKRRHCFTDEAREFGIEPPKGILLAGPPGTGKSLLAKAVASVMGLPLIKFDVSRVFAGIVGQSEERVRSALKMVDSMAPCVLMIDEVDKALGGAHNGGGDSGVSKRVLGAILTWMQETKAPVFSVMSANRVDGLPAELLRRGRLDEIFSVSTPNERERAEIIRIHLRNRKQDPNTVPNIDAAVAKCEGFVPAEIECAVKDAIIDAFTEQKPVTGELIAKQFSNMVPLSEAFADDFASMKTWAENNARPANRDYTAPLEEQTAPALARRRERPASTGGRKILGLVSGDA